MKALRPLCLSLALLMTGYLWIHTATASSNSWTIATIDDLDSGYYVHYSYTSIAVDDEDKVHCTYRNPSYGLNYVTNESGNWHPEVVYDVPANVARENALALDSNNRPHISFSYSDGGAEDLMYANNLTGTWNIVTVDSTGSSGMENDIALDSNDRVHISHWNWATKELKYSTNTSGTWFTQVVTGNVGWDRTSLAIDSNNKVHIVYQRVSSTQLQYATNENGGWEFFDIGNGSSPSLAFDTNDKAHLSYATANSLGYTTNESGLWTTETITTGINPERSHSIAVDNQNKIHISYYDSAQGDLKYVTNVTGQWVGYTVDSVGEVGRSNSIAVDGQGYIHFSYRDDTHNKLKYATNAPIPLAAVTIKGPTVGIINHIYTFTATTSPTAVTPPITYTWSPPLLSGQGSPVVSYIWPTAGPQSLQVTATNATGTATDTHMIHISVPVAQVAISGPATGIVHTAYTFSATLTPVTATTPITYTWSPLPASGQGLPVASYTWTTGGSKSITLTATNIGGTASDTHGILISVPLTNVTIKGQTIGVLNTLYSFTTIISPTTATTPTTYTWSPPPPSGQGSPVATYPWTTPGPKTLTVTAKNAAGTATDTHSIHIYQMSYLPVLLKP